MKEMDSRMAKEVMDEYRSKIPVDVPTVKIQKLDIHVVPPIADSYKRSIERMERLYRLATLITVAQLQDGRLDIERHAVTVTETGSIECRKVSIAEIENELEKLGM